MTATAPATQRITNAAIAETAAYVERQQRAVQGVELRTKVSVSCLKPRDIVFYGYGETGEQRTWTVSDWPVDDGVVLGTIVVPMYGRPAARLYADAKLIVIEQDLDVIQGA